MRVLRQFIREAMLADEPMKSSVFNQLKALGVDEFLIRFHFPYGSSTDEYEIMAVYLDNVLESGGRWMNQQYAELSPELKEFIGQATQGHVASSSGEINSACIVTLQLFTLNHPEQELGITDDELTELIESKGWNVRDTGYMTFAYDPKHWDEVTHGEMEKMSDEQVVYAVEGGGLGADDAWLYAHSRVSRAAVRDALMSEMFVQSANYRQPPEGADWPSFWPAFYDNMHEYANALRQGNAFVRTWEDGEWIEHTDRPYVQYHLSSTNINNALDDDMMEVGRELLDIGIEG